MITKRRARSKSLRNVDPLACGFLATECLRRNHHPAAAPSVSSRSRAGPRCSAAISSAADQSGNWTRTRRTPRSSRLKSPGRSGVSRGSPRLDRCQTASGRSRDGRASRVAPAGRLGAPDPGFSCSSTTRKATTFPICAESSSAAGCTPAPWWSPTTSRSPAPRPITLICASGRAAAGAPLSTTPTSSTSPRPPDLVLESTYLGGRETGWNPAAAGPETGSLPGLGATWWRIWKFISESSSLVTCSMTTTYRPRMFSGETFTPNVANAAEAAEGCSTGPAAMVNNHMPSRPCSVGERRRVGSLSLGGA